jgi:hypothetical protein
MSETQRAVLTRKDGSTTYADVVAFPANPEGVCCGGCYYVANSPVIGYGASDLFYHEVKFVPVSPTP